MSYRGRFAPSPTGPLHFGSLVAATASWLDARAARGEWLVRIEDIDAPRTVPGAADEILRTLEALGLHWDGAVVRQSERLELYETALEQLRQAGRVYRCRCSRREIADSAVHGLEGSIYPGTCRFRAIGPGEPASDRAIAPEDPVTFDDRVQGRVTQDVAREIGDFILKRRDRLHAYQLAVVVDDAAQGITDVVRGADLLWSTPRQIALQDWLGYRTPSYLHVPIAANRGGEKLSKQTHAPAIRPDDSRDALRAALEFLGQAPAGGDSPEEILAHAAASWNAGLIPRRQAIPVAAESAG